MSDPGSCSKREGVLRLTSCPHRGSDSRRWRYDCSSTKSHITKPGRVGGSGVWPWRLETVIGGGTSLAIGQICHRHLNTSMGKPPACRGDSYSSGSLLSGSLLHFHPILLRGRSTAPRTRGSTAPRTRERTGTMLLSMHNDRITTEGGRISKPL
jgi:hypothetical protein